MDKFISKWCFPLDDSPEEESGRRGEHYNFETIANNIIEKFQVEKEDAVLDLCCGNAALTKFIARSCKKIHGVDHSEMLIATAKKLKAKENITNLQLHQSSAFLIDKIFSENFFDKSFCYFSFQYFKRKERAKLLEKISFVTKHNGWIFLGDIPDKSRMKNYYESKKNFYREKISRLIKLKEGECFLGWWIEPKEILDWCGKNNLKASVIPQSENLPHAHYRFDVLIKNCK